MTNPLFLVGVVLLAVLLVGIPLGVSRRRRGPTLEPPAQRPREVRPGRGGAGTAPGDTRPPATRPRAQPPAAQPPTQPLEAAPPASAPPVTEAPTTEAPTTEAPATEAPTTEAPTTEAPTTEAPTTEAPTTEAPVAAPPATAPATPTVEEPAELAPLVKPRFRDRMGKARALFAGFVSRQTIDRDTWDELEEALIGADVGVGLATTLLDELRSQVKAEGITTSEGLVEALKANLKKTLASADRGLRLDPGETNVWLFVGVNGVGKTTTIGKLGYRQALAGHKVVMAAGDTFRAAAAEQLELWSSRVGADLVRGAEGSDPGAVIFDAIQRAASRQADIVLGDTAGRLHTKVNLMEELKKVRRICERPPGHLTEVLLVIDATTGQNGLIQAKEFADAVDVTGVVLTKLDGTAKGGIALAIQTELGIPIKLVGLGETVGDLTEFDPDEFVDALLDG